jgi:protein-S-isoprenylcysteine O-methyltransferase Ste14
MVADWARARIDLGKLVMIPIASLMLAFDLVSLAHRGADGADGALRWLGVAGLCAFYALVIWCYLRRTPAVATSRSVTGNAAALVATFAPFPFPLLQATPPGTGRQLTADVFVLAGTSCTVWSLRFLGRNLSVLAQARDVVDRGPYRWVRHPLYTGEIVSSLGLAIAAWSAPAAALWLALCLLQGYRAVREEQVLMGALSGYRAYRRRTAALLPGIF